MTRSVTPDFAPRDAALGAGAWVFLTLGITAGSYWAYYELGWGGWWFWDPVENASLMPWLAATALLHSVSVLAARDALRTWTIMLGVVAFSMSMVGTFLVRSGILTSVHAFAVDPTRGSFILVLLALYIGGALALFAVRARSIAEGERFAAASREGALVFNNVMLSAILGVVLIGTLYPLLTEAFDVRVSVGPPYFNPVAAIFAVPMLAVMAVGPLLRWREDRPGRVARPVILAAGAALLALGVVVAVDPAGALPTIGLALAAGLAVASVLPLRGRRPGRVKLATWGMVTAHLGIAVALFGMAAESAYSSERLVALEEGGAAEVADWTVTLERVDPVAGPNWTALEAALVARHESGALAELDPAGARLLVARSANLRGRAGDAVERPALRRAGRADGRRALAVALVVEALRHLHLVWRAARGAGRGAVARRPDRRGRAPSPPAHAHPPPPGRGRGGAGAAARRRRDRSADVRRWHVWVPLIAFAGFLALAAFMLAQPKDEFVRSAMIGEQLPDFDLPPATDDRPGLATADLANGEPKLLNIWASWCVPCVAEAPHLATLARAGAPIHGVAIRDRREDVAAFLERYGNPYARIGADDRSAVQLELGSSGVPETFVVDGNGVIQYQHIGDVRAEHVPLLLAELDKARGA